jgi:hypothetical protein
MDSNGKRLKSARTSIGRAYRDVGNAMSLMSPTADANNIRGAIGQLETALASLRTLVPSQPPNENASEYPDSATPPTDWYFVDYSLPRSEQCPTGRKHLRVLAFTDLDAIARAAIILESQGLEFRARINFARKDAQ